jgi:hypothetical protein
VLTEGPKAKRRKANQRDWNKAKEQQFLTVLAETCNVTQACLETGVSTGSAYKRRQKVAAFRAAWAAAIAVAYQRLEMELLQRAFNGTEKVTTRRDGSEERVREVSSTLGMQLLRMHRETAEEADREFSSEEADEIRERLIAKLKRLKARNAQKAGE